jgi:hypothetical protein
VPASAATSCPLDVLEKNKERRTMRGGDEAMVLLLDVLKLEVVRQPNRAKSFRY